ncbi:MAG: hypothetical protein OJF59_000390 [Cytophagales bacterium]|jgi:membrane protease YdiL (CAAX protease family)|nr:CPBP family intramembrane metalloprotease [Bacteroidota bacterium]MBS1981128.1 CPBP family intramembrane metalloprotease [Bacteroidota bacterium]WHZ06637.1 MAG: hypothetical protein OJF59_000390 [Cytophagales bacterium]
MEELNERPVWYTLLMVTLGGMVGLIVGSAVGMLVGAALYQGNGDFFHLVENPDEHSIIPLMTMQGIVSILSFFVFPFLSWRLARRKSFSYFTNQKFYTQSVFFVGAIVLSFMVVDSVIIEWNQHIHFPAFLKSFEEWARASEDRLTEVTKALTQFHSFGEFLVGFLVIAVVAGFCEELLFRGIIQNEFYRGTKNIHLAVWVSAVLFSAIHMQFFGFVPRMLLGALFGYLYFWSGNIFVPMLAHVVNNGFSVILIYLNQLGVVEVNIESEEAAPWYAVGVFFFITTGLIYSYKKFLDQKIS